MGLRAIAYLLTEVITATATYSEPVLVRDIEEKAPSLWISHLPISPFDLNSGETP
jgi:hypothetical protein